MLSFFERVKIDVKGINGFFILGTNSRLISSYCEIPLMKQTVKCMSVFLDSIRSLKGYKYLLVEGEKGKLIVYKVGDLDLGLSCDTTINVALLDVTIRQVRAELEQRIYAELHEEAKKLKDTLKKVAHQYMGSAGEALVEREFSNLEKNTSAVLVQVEKSAALLIGPTRASAMRNELEAVIGGIQYG